MPRYYLNIRCDGEWIQDPEGADFPHLDAARTEAIRSIRSLVCGDVRDGALYLGLSIEIQDGQGQGLGSVEFDDAITTKPAGSEVV
jgi:hypothetical protein